VICIVIQHDSLNDMNRTPPLKIRQGLRKEVNFGCPVPNCGTPYLTWHHFDPPWREKNHHDPNGMIALCPNHASLADGGKWTKKQIREMKERPYINTTLESEEFGYLRKQIVCRLGNLAYDVPNILEINGERVIGFERDSEGCLRLNILLRDSNNTPILIMENNDWIAYPPDLFDLVCAPQGRELQVKGIDSQTEMKIRFDDYTLEEFRNIRTDFIQQGIRLLEESARRAEESGALPSFLESYQQSIANMDPNITSSMDGFIQRMGSPETITTCSVSGTISWNDSILEITEAQVRDVQREIIISGCFISGGRTAFSFNTDGNMSIA